MEFSNHYKSQMQTLTFHPRLLDRLIDELEQQPLCASAIIPLETHTFDRHQNTLRLRSAMDQARQQLKEEGMGDKLDATSLESMTERLRVLSSLSDDEVPSPSMGSSLAVFVTPEHSLMLTVPESLDAITMLGDHPYTLSLRDVSNHYNHDYFYVVDVNNDSLTLWRATRDGEVVSLLERSMEEIDFAPAAEFADGENDGALQSHSGSSGRGPRNTPKAVYHTQADQAQRNFMSRQKRFFRDAHQQIVDMIDNGQAPVLLRGERHQRLRYQDVQERRPDLYTMELDKAARDMTSRATIRKLWDELQEQGVRHKDLVARWHDSASRGLTESDPATIANLAARGMIDVLFVSRARPLWGSFDMESGALSLDEKSEGHDEVCDRVARRVVELGGQAHVLREDHMPCTGSMCAILRGNVSSTPS